MDLNRRIEVNLARNAGALRAVLPLLILVACGLCLARQPIRVRTNLVNAAFTARNQSGIRVMQPIAKETSRVEFDAKTTDPRQNFNQIGEELRSLYEAGYYSTNSDKDETFRKVAVRTTA